MCDEGRFSYKKIDEGRIQSPCLRHGEKTQNTDWETIIKETSTILNTTLSSFGPTSIAVITSPQLSNEELNLTQKLFLKVKIIK